MVVCDLISRGHVYHHPPRTWQLMCRFFGHFDLLYLEIKVLKCDKNAHYESRMWECCHFTAKQLIICILKTNGYFTLYLHLYNTCRVSPCNLQQLSKNQLKIKSFLLEKLMKEKLQDPCFSKCLQRKDWACLSNHFNAPIALIISMIDCFYDYLQKRDLVGEATTIAYYIKREKK